MSASIRRPGVVSVVVPVYDVAEYLGPCVESILGQEYPHLDVVLVDDGSTDGSGDLCDELARGDRRVRVIHQANRGLSHARNVGLDAAEGEFVTFVDSDDWLHTGMVSRLLTLLSDAEADVACGGFVRVQVPGEAVTSGSGVAPQVLGSPEEAIWALLGARHTQLTIACAKVFRAEVLDGVRFPVGRLHEDEFTTYRAIHACRRVVVTGEPVYFYRQRAESITASDFSVRRGLDMIDAFDQRAQFLRENGLHRQAVTAETQTFRKYLQLLHWLGTREPELRARLVADMRRLRARVAGEQVSWTFRLASGLCVWSPALGTRLYGWQARLRGLRLPA